ncbi:unnamed protein product [Dicrocoelium dendriticum]|nr:unnamed protein product [Dicrocoelium dendriticum]CAH8614295.1 unnamed protein product [Dicrocoelium dendriticum]
MGTLKDQIDSCLTGLKHCTELPQILLRVLHHPNLTSNLDPSISYLESDTLQSSDLYHVLYRLFKVCGDEQSQLTYDVFAQCAVRISQPDLVFRFLCDRLDCEREADHLEVIIQHLELFLFEFRRLPDVLSEWCSAFEDILFYEKLVRVLTSLPTRAANRLGASKKSRLFDRKLFVSIILSSFVFDAHTESRWSLYGLIVSQLVLTGYSSEVASFILSDIEKDQCSGQIPCSTWSHIVPRIKERSLEMFLLPVLRFSSHPHIVAALLPREPLSSPTSAYMRLFRRLLFVRYFPQGQIVRNIFGALAELANSFEEMEARDTVFHIVNEHLGFPALRLWADATAIQATSVEQRIYNSQALASWLSDFYVPLSSALSFKVSNSLLLPDVLSGISNHLASPRQEVRLIGMAVGEWIVGFVDLACDSASRDTLKFTYEETDVVQQLRPFFSPIAPFTPLKLQDPQVTSEVECDHQTVTTSAATQDHPDVLDSDDDPEPSNPPEATLPPLPQRPGQKKQLSSFTNTSERRPRYLRECLDGMLLTKPEDNQISVACFEAAADLIYAHPQGARELATELAHVFVHLEPPACPDEGQLATKRHAALVALGVVAPKQCARYLTNEFCQPNCSLGQRQNIIAAITDIACTLSTTEISASPKVHDPPPQVVSVKTDPKTRRFCSKPAAPTQTVNSFITVAGEFFFPLLRSIPQLFCSSQADGVFAHQDASLLSNLIASLATVYACAQFAPVQLRMATELMEILPSLYKHSEPAVRRAVLIAVGTVITTTPSSILSSNPQLFIGAPHIEETSLSLYVRSQASPPSLVSWLKRCATLETDSECQLLASVGLSSLVERVQSLADLR